MGRIITINDGVMQASVFDGAYGLAHSAVTITAGNTSVNWAHGLGVIPRIVSISAQDDNGADWKETARTAALITITIPVPQIADADFYIGAIP